MSDADRCSDESVEGRPGSSTAGHPIGEDAAGRSRVEPMRLAPLLPRRQNPWLLVDVDGSPSSHGALVWALREAARREATVVAVCVIDDDGDAPAGLPRLARRGSTAVLDRLEAQVLRAIAETGVVGRVRTAVLERPVFEALSSAARGADLVVVSGRGKTLLRPAVPRQPARRLVRGA
ncbi:universal stress protein [Geodermatophilus sp. DF01-2]|uniref:universal stress protein n=1 Tax=Geodermatophilus sp. DF01-2 TaxID=2559610 RepID=UPI00107490D8|nr:universal stress protein [Geodermatophilus sp. DF01_2]TFV54600.1 universal stress protein [Geodermatophilus sp. DF01_2]